MTLRSLLAATTLMIGALANGVALAADTCVPAKQAEGLMLYVAPTLIGTVSATCAPVLPSNALLRSGTARLTAKYAAESASAWPQAREALKLVAGADAAQLLDSDMGKSMVPALIGPLIAQEVKPGDCASINRVMTLIDPLPARNTAALIVTIIDLSGRKKADRPGGFRICPNESPIP